MKIEGSPFYPPRAGRLSHFASRWYEIRRLFRLERVRSVSHIGTADFVRSLLVPGYAFKMVGRPFLARAIMIGYAAAACVFLVALGYVWANAAFAVMLGLHSTSILFLLQCRDGAGRLRNRIFLSLATILILSQLVYSPLFRLIERNLFMPVRHPRGVTVVNPRLPPKRVQRGDLIVCTLAEVRVSGVNMPKGLSFAPVLAMAGDEIQFDSKELRVNGLTVARQAHMPRTGVLVVPEKHWFIWPKMDISGAISDQAITGGIMKVALVSHTQLLGRPYKRWFGRPQPLP